MKEQRVFWLLLLVTVLNSARTKVTLSYFLNGGNLTMRPVLTPPITSILWKRNGDLLAEWILDNIDLTYYGDYNNRTNLDIKTGHLDISKMDETKDSSLYTLEINNNVHGERYDAKVITEVPKPKVWIRPLTCNHSRDNCTLSCDGDTAKAEPVTYTWMMDDKELNQTTKEVEILKTETEDVKTFSCRMKNPVSEEESEPKENLFFQEEPSVGPEIWHIFLRVGLHMVIWGIVGFLMWKNRDTVRKAICARQDKNRDDNSV